MFPFSKNIIDRKMDSVKMTEMSQMTNEFKNVYTLYTFLDALK